MYLLEAIATRMRCILYIIRRILRPSLITRSCPRFTMMKMACRTWSSVQLAWNKVALQRPSQEGEGGRGSGESEVKGGKRHGGQC